MAALRADQRLARTLSELLVVDDDDRCADADRDAVRTLSVQRALDRFVTFLGELIDQALSFALTDDAEHLADIRLFFVAPRDSYSVRELSAIWRVPIGDVKDLFHDALMDSARALDHEEVEPRIQWADALGASTSFGLFRPSDVERALGEDFLRYRSDRWRTVPVLIHLPQFVVDAAAFEALVPSTLNLPSRIEQLLLVTTALADAEYLRNQFSGDDDDDDGSPRQHVPEGTGSS